MKLNIKKTFFFSRRGISLYVAILFVTAMLIVSGALAKQIIVSEQNRARYDKQAQIELMAHSAEEAATWLANHALPAGGLESEIAPVTLTSVTTQLLAAAEAAGIDTSDCDEKDGVIGNGGDQCFEVKISGRSRDEGNLANNGRFFISFNNETRDRLYSVPRPGTGNVLSSDGESGGCVSITEKDDPCNWNKLKYGDSVRIPLFYETANPNYNPGDANSPKTIVHTLDVRNGGAFYLRMRTPCNENAANANMDAISVVNGQNGEVGAAAPANVSSALATSMLNVFEKIPGTPYPRNCPANERITLFPATNDAQNYLTFANDPVIVQWMLQPENGEELVAREKSQTNPRVDPLRRPTFASSLSIISRGQANLLGNVNSQLSAGLLNFTDQDQYSFVNLFHLIPGNFVRQETGDIAKIQDYLFSNSGKRLWLNLKSVSFLRRADNRDGKVPYLEYQLLTSAPITDASTKIEVTVRLLGISTKKTAVLKEKGAGETFVLGNL